ncbi:MAG: hypothetical protein ACYSR6_03545 [Planctomycetota bacterium]|jgi:hypothetical protein
MMSRTKLAVLISLVLVIASAQIALAERYAVELGANELNAVSPKDTTLGNYYVVKVGVPDVLDGKELFKAILELTVDVAATEVEGCPNETPILEVYALTDEMENELDSSKFKTPTPLRRNIRVGNNRHIRMDITQIVKDYIKNPENNHGLVFGSLSNSRDGLFTVKSSGGALGVIIATRSDSHPL